jgi:hypothetical protein
MEYLVFIGAAAVLVGALGYARDTLYGETKPNRVTWFLWMLAPFIATAAAISDGVGWAVLPVFMAGFGPLLVLLASFASKEAYWELGWLDYACGFLSILALALWAITEEPLVAIIFAIIADGLAALPTLSKAWQYPETESAGIYVASFFSAVTGLAAVQYWGAAEYAFPIYLIIINAVLIFVVVRKRFLVRSV